MIRALRQRMARRRLARIRARTIAANIDFTINRQRQLSPDRKAHIAALVDGIVQERKSV
ncbi:hypothetical protein PX699_13455 [Sphingobium sp. H39-3-25]|uniref:hypothetical protein n=1 Tax=Sphingobium arseniciresistens TaxID=3030834 RepID=UPI0023B8B4CF|nr:hypothetical protein [Sphingobium arseniciresistens]